MILLNIDVSTVYFSNQDNSSQRRLVKDFLVSKELNIIFLRNSYKRAVEVDQRNVFYKLLNVYRDYTQQNYRYTDTRLFILCF